MDKQRIAEAYLAAPGWRTDQEVVHAYRTLATECQQHAAKIMERLTVVETTNDEPYPTAAAMFRAIESGVFHVSIEHCDHPLWTPAENVAFRIVHDNLGHYGIDGDSKAPFSWQGEIAAYNSQSRFHSAPAQRALFTEIVGQTAVFSLTGEFPEQKAILLPRELDA